ncbi:2,3-bisphosphoglycerate-independent phosphoglycerate mutase [Natronorarus salvus]|uniref:2,3-bisphosphoglycerate-independent phosphoglycerate mutase n=1 Tax=Natronorarus salvus TaxID=3117733 RepID=UPI002F26033F
MDAALVILDGWGLSGTGDSESAGHRDAVRAAETPVFDRIREEGAFGTLDPTGRAVGLPDGQMGNSEVGHLTIGAGRVVNQAYTRIDDAIEVGELAENPAIAGAFEHVRSTGGRLHFMGLVSDGGVHSDQAHLHALIELAAENGVAAVTHAFTDGRDTDPHGGAEYLRALSAAAEEYGTGHVATVSGRYYAMDRDGNWERTKRAYDAIVLREAEHVAPSAPGAVEAAYEREVTDEFVEPTLIEGGVGVDDGHSTDHGSAGSDLAVRDGDAVVFFNFRGDRGRQLTRMLADIRPEWRFEVTTPEIHLVTATEYDATFGLPVAFPPQQPEETLGEVLAREGHTQLRIAESEKYAHVTYFLNGGREVEFAGEVRKIVPSPGVPTYDLQPEMSAPAVTDTAREVIESEDPDVLVLNYANPDMVGHTGDFEAAVAACEAVDAQLSRLLETLRAHGSHVVVTADHGNADDMGTEERPHTAHTYNPVPVIYTAPDGTDGGYAIREGGTLADLAPTLLSLLGVVKPGVMTGENLLVSAQRPS